MDIGIVEEACQGSGGGFSGAMGLCSSKGTKHYKHGRINSTCIKEERANDLRCLML